MLIKYIDFINEAKHNNNIFVRWGGANSVNQKGKKNISDFHKPPFGRGIYAFPIKCVEPYLAGHRLNERHSRIYYDGEIWHHLIDEVKNRDILKRNGSWILTNFNTWEKAYNKNTLNLRLQTSKGKTNLEEDSSGNMNYYWCHYMLQKYSYYLDHKDEFTNKLIKDIKDDTLRNKFERYLSKRPSKEDFNDEDFIRYCNDDRYLGYHTSWEDNKNRFNHTKTGIYSMDHLEVFLPNVK